EIQQHKPQIYSVLLKTRFAYMISGQTILIEKVSISFCVVENITKRSIFVWFSLVVLLYIDDKATLFGGWGLFLQVVAFLLATAKSTSDIKLDNFVISMVILHFIYREGYISNHINRTNLLMLIDKKWLY
ncbi:hypothetical protein ACJX0J_042583, partial [Zea mays]